MSMTEEEEQQMNDELILMTLQQKERDRHNIAKQKAIDKLIEKYYTRAFTLQLQRGACEVGILNEAYNFCKKEEELETARVDKIAEEKGYKEKEEYTFITINPENQLISPVELHEEVEKIVNKTKWINENDYAYVIEQRSENPAEYSGVHCHLLVHTKDKPNYEIRRELKNKLKHIVNMEEVKKFDIGKNRKGPLSILPTVHYQNRFSYMLDWKNDPAKHRKQINDREIRKKYNLENVYFSGELFSQYILEYNSQINNGILSKEES